MPTLFPSVLGSSPTELCPHGTKVILHLGTETRGPWIWGGVVIWLPVLPSLRSLGKAVVLGLPPPPGYAITQKLPAAPKPHTEFPNKTCENRSPVAALATFGNCSCPQSTSRLESLRHSPLQMQTRSGWTLSLRPIQERLAWNLRDLMFSFFGSIQTKWSWWCGLWPMPLPALQVHALGSCGLEETPCLLASLQGSCVLTSSCKGSRHQALPTPSSYQLPCPF